MSGFNCNPKFKIKKEDLSTMNFIIWLLMGALAGWAAGQLLKGHSFGLLWNIIYGLIGGVVGGWLFGMLGVGLGGGLLGDFIAAVVGAIIVIIVVGEVRKRR
jgi:uncharacterized membrane protein YeaQ/YmgE (transglycosylase-associated protein family)